jgi:eukaryotic-like serine/threonine-protein kinase
MSPAPRPAPLASGEPTPHGESPRAVATVDPSATGGEATALLPLAEVTAAVEPGGGVYAIQAGSVIAGKYKVIRHIGRGGMGLVVEARHLSFDGRVAIKLLLPEFMSYSEASGRFLREARAAARLGSQNVAQVIDTGTLDGGEPFLVMEYLAGEDLAIHTRAHGPIAIAEAVDWVAQACDGLAEAHDKGIVHRDIKPANLFLTRRPDGGPLIKVLDFGISKVLGDGEHDVALTHTTTILGSALYMSPEQMQSAKRVDRRTDVYALGVCLFELIGGAQPYFAESFPELCAKVFTSPPASLRALRPEVPEGLEKAIERALARDPDKRWQSVVELLVGISPWARMDTRARMKAVIERYRPGTELLPLAPLVVPGAPRGASIPSPSRESAAHPAAPARGARAAASPTLEDRSAAATANTLVSERAGARGAVGRWPWFVAVGGVAVAAALAWQLGAGGGPTAAEPSVATPPTHAPAAAPPVEVAAPAQPALPTPSATASAPPSAMSVASPISSAAPVAAGPLKAPPAAKPGATGAPAAAQPPTAGTAASPPAAAPTPPPSKVNGDLVQETCRATMPDGTVKVVPCP